MAAQLKTGQGTGAQGQALQRLLDLKGPVRQKNKDEDAFLHALDDVLICVSTLEEQGGNWLDGSISGQCWQAFMHGLRSDLLKHLEQYRAHAQKSDFSPASLTSLKSERQRIERLYVRDLVQLYQQAAQTYKTLSG